MVKTTSVSIRGVPYRTALAMLAKTKKVSVGDLVREAVDAKWGEELKPILEFLREFDPASFDEEPEVDDEEDTLPMSPVAVR